MNKEDAVPLLRRALALKGDQLLFPWQQTLLECMLEGTAPELIDIPTGMGKTSVIAIWAVARSCGARLPRRLVYCLPMRVLVEQTRTRAIEWLANVDLLAGKAEFDDGRLKSYQVNWDGPDKIAVITLMGGEVLDEWVEHPERAAVIVGTQDMLLSRALNRGYAMAPQRWPVDFGFLNVDTLWVMDEVQLMGPGRTTSVQLQTFWDERPTSYGLRRSVWMSATLGSQEGSQNQASWMKTPERENRTLSCAPLRPSKKDFDHPEFRTRWTAPKRLELRFASTTAASATPGRRRRARGEALPALETRNRASWTFESDELVERVLREAEGGRLVLVFVNQVGRAQQLYARIKRQVSSQPEVLLLHARMRPQDRKRIVARLDSKIPPTGRVVVTTQVLEAGVDIDAHALFTELCPWPSLVQRLGRLNRSGTRPAQADVQRGKRPAPAIILDVPRPERGQGKPAKEDEERSKREAALPYEWKELDATKSRLEEVVAKHAGSLSPETLAGFPVTLDVKGPILRRFDLDDLFDTDPDLSGGYIDVSVFIRALDREVDAYVLWRRIEGGGGADQQVPIHPDELCPVPFYEAREAFQDRRVWILTLATGRKKGPAWRMARGQDIHAGDTVMIDVPAGGYREDIGWTGMRDDKPTHVVDRWEHDNGTAVRAWVRLDGKKPSLHQKIDRHVVSPRARGEDPRSFTKHWLELDRHLDLAEEGAKALAQTLGLPQMLKKSLVLAARWHDVGKALEREADGRVVRPFQEMLRSAGVPEYGHPKDGVLYAKSNRQGGKPAGFRHELASLLACLEAGAADPLAAYLVVSHHGKVRLLPEPWDENDLRDLCGVRPGDQIPSGALPSGAMVILDPRRLLPSPSEPGWQGRVGKLLQQHGPFLLAYLEGLLRVGDWRAE